jgi:ParB family chromosome partitioning protein
MDEKPNLKKRSALGKGLGALLADADNFTRKSDQVETERPDAIAEIPLSEIVANPFQPRTEFDQQALEELAASIKEHGIIQPITLRKLTDHEYQLIAGERRWRASQLAGLERVPAYVRTANDQQMLEMAIIENVQREDLNPIEVALSYQRLISECNLRQEDLGTRVGKQRSTVTNYLRLLRLPPQIQVGLRDKKLSMGHARTLVNIDDIALQLAVYERIVKEDLSVRQSEELVRKLSKPEKEKEVPVPVANPNERALQAVQQKLASYFGTSVKVQSDAEGKGNISISFESIDDLNRVLDMIDYH